MLPNCFRLDVWCVCRALRAVANLQGRAVKPLVYAVYVTTVPDMVAKAGATLQ